MECDCRVIWKGARFQDAMAEVDSGEFVRAETPSARVGDGRRLLGYPAEAGRYHLPGELRYVG